MECHPQRQARKEPDVTNFIQVDIAAFKAHVAILLEKHPELADDDDLRADMFEGETDMIPIVSRLVSMKLDADTMTAAVKLRKQEISERLARYERKGEGVKALIKSVMIAAGIPKVTLPDATVSVLDPRVVVEITDLDAIPQGFAKFEKKPDKTALKAALMAGEEVPGAALGFSEESLMVRTK
jgi:hypothetical protein